MMTDDDVRRLMAASLHDDRTQAHEAIEIRVEETDEPGQFALIPSSKLLHIDMLVHRGGWVTLNNKYDQDTIIFKDDIDTIIALLQRARDIMRGEV